MEALLDEKPAKYIDAMVLEHTIDTRIVLRVLDTSKCKISTLFKTIGFTNVTRGSDCTPWGWVKHRKGKTLLVEMPVSFCNHEHDCCGCLCVYRLEMSMHGKYLMVIEEKQFNY